MKPLTKDKNYKKGTQFFNRGDYSKAITEFNNSLKTYKDNPLIYANLGLSYANLEQYDKAIEFLDKALELDINQGQIWDAKVSLLDKLGRTEELTQTMKKFDESVKKNPELLGIKLLTSFNPPIPEGLKLYSLGKVAKQPSKAIMKQASYFLSLLKVPRQNVEVFYFNSELLIAIEEIPGVWMKSAFKDLKISNLFNLYEKDDN